MCDLEHLEDNRPAGWDRLFETASAQAGYFTARQAGELGYSPQLLQKYLKSRKIVRARRGIYRLVHFPAADHEELVIAWLWSEQAGVISHQTALALHELSDALPAKIHLTLPLGFRRRRLRVPEDIVLHFAEVPEEERAWFGAVPATNPARTLNDCAQNHLSPEVLRQATEQALARGIAARGELTAVHFALAPFGGLGE